MSTPEKQKIIAIVGTNASGKSSLAVRLAKKFNGEIISADSRQVYRGLDIGSGKITKKERRGVPHHLLDVASPRKLYTVTHFIKDASRAIKDITKRGKTPILCGGTGFWIDALLTYPVLPQVKPNIALRKRLKKWSTGRLFSLLLSQDPRRANSIDRHNPYRLIRAIEIIRATKKPVPPLKKEMPNDILYIGIMHAKKVLNKKIELRLKSRLRHGLIKEVQRLHKNGLPWKKLEQFGLEYRYVAFYLQGKMKKHEMEEKLLSEIIKYAKRQVTWFKKNKYIFWIQNKTEAFKLSKAFLMQHPSV